MERDRERSSDEESDNDNNVVYFQETSSDES